MNKQIKLNNITFSNDSPLVLIAGLNVLEDYNLAAKTCETIQKICSELKIPYVFKASFDKANRSSITSYRGPGLKKGIEIFKKLKKEFNVPIITDIHEPHQAEDVAEVADILQLPAFLSRQTDLIEALAKTGKLINIKKAQFLAPQEMKHILKKFEDFGNNNLMLCERGTMFGYNNLVVDMLGFPIMKSFGYPLIFDVTHSLQLPGGLSTSAGGRGQFALDLAKSGVVQGLAGLFIETHPDPNSALCDGPCALPLSEVKSFLSEIVEVDKLAKTSEKCYNTEFL